MSNSRSCRLRYHIAVIALMSLFCLTAASSAFPVTIWKPPWENQFISKAVGAFFPQGWGFFTRTSEEPLTTPWRVEPIEELSELPTSRTRNWFGLRRDGRAQGVEIGSLQDQIEEDDWNECTFMDSPAECVSKISQDYTRVSVTNLTRNPTLCDSVVLLEREPVPLLYRDKLDQYTRALRWVGLDIDCES